MICQEEIESMIEVAEAAVNHGSVDEDLTHFCDGVRVALGWVIERYTQAKLLRDMGAPAGGAG